MNNVGTRYIASTATNPRSGGDSSLNLILGSYQCHVGRDLSRPYLVGIYVFIALNGSGKSGAKGRN